jgi:hypothetical protein
MDLTTRGLRAAAVTIVLAAVACSGPALVESSANAVTIRYDAADGIDEATQLARKACAARHQTARLRITSNFGLIERYAHFDCV